MVVVVDAVAAVVVVAVAVVVVVLDDALQHISDFVRPKLQLYHLCCTENQYRPDFSCPDPGNPEPDVATFQLRRDTFQRSAISSS